MPTLLEYRTETARKLGGFLPGVITLDPDPSDILAQRSVLSDQLFDADKNSKGLANEFIWVGQYRDQRRCRDNGYRTLFFNVFIPPTSGTYTLTLYGFGVTDPIAFDADATVVQDAIIASSTELGAVTVSGDGNPFIISVPDNIDMETTAGTMVSQGGIGAIEVNRSFTRALRRGDTFEKHVKLPVDDDGDFQGLNTVINMALSRMWFISKFPVTPVRNSRGVPTFFGLSDVPWLTDQKQIIALYHPAEWEMSSTFTPPVSGTYTLTVNMATATYTTASLAFGATAAEIQTALGLVVPVFPITVTDTGATFLITLGPTFYATPTLAASAGTVSNNINMLTSPARAPQTWKFQSNADKTYIDNYFGQEGYSFFIEGYRSGSTWYAPQESYGTIGNVWTSTKTGLLNDYDQAYLPVADVSTIAYYFACLQLAAVGPSSETNYWKGEALKAGRAAAAVKLYDLAFDNKPRGGYLDYGPAWGSKGFWLPGGF